MDSSLPEGWMELCSKAGETFFYHFETGESPSRFSVLIWIPAPLS